MAHYATDEPVYALATPYSPSALAVIRASGEGVLSIFQPYFTGRITDAPSGKAVHGYVKDECGERIDEVMTVVYRKGHGYTSEEAFEIMCHGSLPVIRSLSVLLERAGIREAERGEFTYRAFMHGRMDLTEAEAVEEIVKARTERAGSDALSRLTGSIYREAEAIKDSVLNILASLEVQLDYGEDEIPEEWVFPHDEVRAIITRLRSIAATFASSRLYSEGASVVIAGRTNAGKSSLFNALLKENRAIVSSEEGTTRDYIETEAVIRGIPVRLFDTAGFRETDGSIELEGIRRTEELMEKADLIIYVSDPSSGDDPHPDDDSRTLTVSSKRDITGRDAPLSFSSVTGEGLDEVIDAIAERLSRGTEAPEGVPRIDSLRQKEKLEEAAEALESAELSSSAGFDIIAMYLQSALSSLGELTGEITGDDILDRLFSSFCLGK